MGQAMKRGQASNPSGSGVDDQSDDDLLLIAVALVKASEEDDDQHFVASVALVFEALKQLRPSARRRRR